MSGASTFAALGHREFRSLWVGFSASQVGEQMQVFAVGWLAIEIALRDGTPELVPLFLGLFGLARAVPGLALGLVGGVLADRVDRRALLLGVQCVNAIVALSLMLLASAGRADVPAVMALVAIASTAAAFDLPTQFATLPRLVGDRDLMSAIGLTNTAANVAMFVGPLLGGAIVGSAGGVSGVFGLQALLAGIAIVALLRVRRMPPSTVPLRDVVGSLRDGVAYVLREPLLRWLIAMAVFVALFGRSVAYVLPAVATEVLRVGAVELSWLLAARGVGTLAGSLATASLGAIDKRGVALALAATVLGAAAMIFSAQTALLPALALAAAMGAAQFMFSGFAGVLMQTASPDALRGRVLSVYFTTVTGVTPLGVLILGTAGTSIGIDVAIAGGAAILVTAGVAAVALPSALRDHRVTAARPAAP